MCLFLCQHNTDGLVSLDEPIDEAAIVTSLASQYMESSLQPADASRKLRTYNLIRGKGYAFQSYLAVFRNLHQRMYCVSSEWAVTGFVCRWVALRCCLMRAGIACSVSLMRLMMKCT